MTVAFDLSLAFLLAVEKCSIRRAFLFIRIIDKAKQPNALLHASSWTIELKGSKNETTDSSVVDAVSCWNFHELLAESTDPNKLVRACLFTNWLSERLLNDTTDV